MTTTQQAEAQARELALSLAEIHHLRLQVEHRTERGSKIVSIDARDLRHLLDMAEAALVAKDALLAAEARGRAAGLEEARKLAITYVPDLLMSAQECNGYALGRDEAATAIHLRILSLASEGK